MAQQDITHLTQAIMDLKGQIERMNERQEEMISDVKKIKDAGYDPDQGLYARLRALEQWKESQAKLQWAIIMTLVGLITTTLYKFIIAI